VLVYALRERSLLCWGSGSLTLYAPALRQGVVIGKRQGIVGVGGGRGLRHLKRRQEQPEHGDDEACTAPEVTLRREAVESTVPLYRSHFSLAQEETEGWIR
jgi:hypothetical protein